MRSFIFLFVFFLAAGSYTFAQDHTNHNHNTKKSDSITVKSETPEVKKDESDSTKIWNTVCPVMGDEVDPEVKTVPYNGKVYGFCCKGCIKKFSNNPEKYAAKLSEDGTKLIDAEKK